MIRLRNVTVAYGDRVILDNINLDIHQVKPWPSSVPAAQARVPSCA